jgi:hypothetical protein
LSQLGGVLLYGKADAEIPLLQKKIKKIKWILELSFKVVIMTLFKGISRGIETHPLLCIRPMVTDFRDLLLLLQSL